MKFFSFEQQTTRRREGGRGNETLAAILSVFLAWSAAAHSAECVFEDSTAPVAATRIDELVAQCPTGPPRSLCSDAVFVRRVYLDLLGVLPSAREARAFINNRKAEKRRDLIERLINREEFADYWAMKWGDRLRIKAEFPINLWPNAAQAYHRWVRAALANNLPYDQFARQLLTSSGSNFRVPPVNFFRAIPNRTPEGIATAVALTFMGTRTESWPSERLRGMAAFFSQVAYKPTREWKEEIVYWQRYRTNGPAPDLEPGEVTDLSTAVTAIFPDGTQVTLRANQDPRELFTEWLTRPGNPWFSRNIANRAWAWFLGRGIIHEPDDLRENNPPSNPALLQYLQSEVETAGYDLKQLFQLILNSRTYQSSCIPETPEKSPEGQYDRYQLRRLEAEVLIDVINQVTGTSDLYTSAIPEPFTYVPENMRAVAIADGSITSPFLALFGRSARATGMEHERVNEMSPAQWLHLLNSSHIQRKIEQGPALRTLFARARNHAEAVDELYLTLLSRFPTVEERAVLQQKGRPVLAGRPQAREEWVDLTWALLNSPEFLYRH